MFTSNFLYLYWYIQSEREGVQMGQIAHVRVLGERLYGACFSHYSFQYFVGLQVFKNRKLDEKK